MNQNGSDKRVVSVQVDGELAARLERLAATQERTLSGEIRVALREHVSGTCSCGCGESTADRRTSEKEVAA